MSLKNRALKAEWRTIGRQRILLASLIVMLFVPIMYGGFFLGSIWDPYGNTKHLPVAVVNEDTGATFEGKTINVGADMVKDLKTNNDMGWRFVSAKDADAGIADGTYYMKLVVPKDFSANATTVASEKPVQSTVQYTLTPARNYVASLLTKEAAKTIASTVSTSVSRAYVDAIFENIGTLKSGMNEAASGASELAAGSSELASGVASYTSGVRTLTAGQQALSGGLAELSSGALSLKNGIGTLGSSLPTATQLVQLQSGVKSIQSGLSALNTAVSTPDSTIVSYETAVATDVATVQAKLGAYATAITAANSSITALQTALAASQATATVNASDMLSVISTSQGVSAEIVTLLTDLNTLNVALASQQGALATNVSSLNSGMTTLAPNLLGAIGGYTSLSSGTTSLLDGANALYSGSIGAASGSAQLLGGLRTLNAASPSLVSGSSQLEDGSTQLSSALSDAASQLALQQTSDATASQIVNPVNTTESVKGDVPNYGYALSPYVLSLGLFVGALVFNVIYPVRRFFDKPRNALSWWASKMSVAALVALGQSAVLNVIMVVGLGLHPDNLAQFMLVSGLTSLTYMSIITFLALSLDNVGRFIAMLLLVLQLGSAEGVFPIVLSSGFFQAVHPFVPMTYSIYAFREAISSGLGASAFWANAGVLAAIMIVTNLCIIAFFRLHGMRHFKHESIDA